MAYYKIVLVVHIVGFISWMAGILYLYRLFINHAERGRQDKGIHELLVGMEDRLYRYITAPAMLVTTAAGLFMLVLRPELFSEGWMLVKLAAVFVLIVATGFAKKLMGRFSQITNPVPSGRKLRLWNEVPTLLMIIIVAMVILRPF